MGEYELQALTNDVRRTKAMVAALLARSMSSTSSGSSGPTADFMVDMFDRANSDDLGGYWNNAEGFAIRNARAICASQYGGGQYSQYGFPGTLSSSGAFYGANYPNGATEEYDTLSVLFANAVFGGANTAAPRLVSTYAAQLSTPDATIKVTFDGPPPALDTVTTQTVMSGGDSTVERTESIVGFLASAGALFAATPTGAKAGALLETSRLPDMNVPGASVGARNPMEFVFGDLSSVATLGSNFMTARDPVTSGAYTSSLGGSVGSVNSANSFNPSPIITSNSLILTASGDHYIASVNGQPMYDGTQALVVNRKLVGICAFPLNLLATCLQLGLPFYGITSFKAWRSDAAEPPSESGYGVFASGKPTYADKYHTAIKDSNGNITGYNYNPNA